MMELIRSAQWLRDTGNQFAHLYRLLPQDKNLQALVKAVINTESRYISQYPYCGKLSVLPNLYTDMQVPSNRRRSPVYRRVSTDTPSTSQLTRKSAHIETSLTC